MSKALIAIAVTLVAPSIALACDCIAWVPGPHFEADVDHVVAGSTAIIDGIVERPMSRDSRSAVVKATRIWKGPNQRRFQIGLVSDCSAAVDEQLVQPHQHVRLILLGGPVTYEANRCTNFQGQHFNRAIAIRLQRFR